MRVKRVLGGLRLKIDPDLHFLHSLIWHVAILCIGEGRSADADVLR